LTNIFYAGIDFFTRSRWAGNFFTPRGVPGRVPGNTDTGIATTTQLTVFYRFSPCGVGQIADQRGIISRTHSLPAVITTPHTMAQTLYDKLWNTHVVHTEEDGTTILYIDRHLLHEVTSPQAFEGL
jgi:hypothetical protein